MVKPAFPVGVRRADHVEWKFSEPLRVAMPGPDSSLSNVRQYKDRIEFEIWPWASVRIEFDEH